MNSFVRQALDKKMNSKNIMGRIAKLERRNAGKPSMFIDTLDQVSPELGTVTFGEDGLLVDGTIINKQINHLSLLSDLAETVTLPGVLLENGNTLIVELTGALWNETGSAQNLTMSVSMGASGSEVAVTSATAVSISNSATQRGFQYMARISQAPCMGTWVLCYEELHVDGANLFQRTSIKKITGIENLSEVNSMILGETLGGTATTWTVYNNQLTVRVEEGVTDTDTVLWWSQPIGSDSYDTSISSAAPTTNYSTDAIFKVGESNAAVNTWRALIKFPELQNLSSVADQYEFVSAYLLLKISDDFSSNARTITVKHLLRDWVLGETTWNVYSTGNSWTTAGALGFGDASTGSDGTFAIGASETVGATIKIPLTITAVTIPTQVYGFILNVDTELNDMYQYHSGNAASPSAAPILQIELRRI